MSRSAMMPAMIPATIPMKQKVESTIAIRPQEWREFLQSFSWRHHRWLVTIETHDLRTNEDVVSHLTPLQSIELDTEDVRNPRINVTVESGNKVIKHILFRPSRLALELSKDGDDAALHIDSVNTATTVRFRVAISPERVDEMV